MKVASYTLTFASTFLQLNIRTGEQRNGSTGGGGRRSRMGEERTERKNGREGKGSEEAEGGVARRKEK